MISRSSTTRTPSPDASGAASIVSMRWACLLALVVVAPLVAAGCSGSHHSSSSSITSGSAPPPGSPPAPPPPPPPPPPGQLGPNDSGQVGSWSARFLQGSPYTSLLVEVDYISSEAPTQSALDTLLTRLRAHCNKPNGITLQTRALNVPGRATWSVQDTFNLELAQRTTWANGPQAVQYFLYLDGKSDQDTANERVLAWTYTGTSTGIFRESLKAATNALVSLAEVEQSVLVHEMGHNLGLVNLGAPLTSNHEDTQHPNHCTNKACSMFWATESFNLQLIQQNGGAPPSDYGPECESDLKANGGK